MIFCRGTEQYLQGGVKFPTGGKVRERIRAEPVRFRYRQYSLDGRRYAAKDLRSYFSPWVDTQGEFCFYEVILWVSFGHRSRKI